MYSCVGSGTVVQVHSPEKIVTKLASGDVIRHLSKLITSSGENNDKTCLW